MALIDSQSAVLRVQNFVPSIHHTLNKVELTRLSARTKIYISRLFFLPEKRIVDLSAHQWRFYVGVRGAQAPQILPRPPNFWTQ